MKLGLLAVSLVLVARGLGRRLGMQTFQLMDTVWVDGGWGSHANGSVAVLKPDFLAYNLSVNFDIPPGPPSQPEPRPAEVPFVAHGFMWSNLVDSAWLFGGQASQAAAHAVNDIWRFKSAGGRSEWTKLDTGVNATVERPYRGAGCNVPDLQTGFYLGGMAESGSGASRRPHYLHWLSVFDMKREVLTTLPVPDFVPIVNQSLVFVDTGSRSGALVALGGLVERKGALAMVAPLTSIYIFDIASRIWFEQSVTGQHGSTDEDDVAWQKMSKDVPGARMSACASVGSALDKTSHNILYIGGQNETHALGDAWVLSLPSGLWFKAPYSDETMSAKADSSCLLLSDSRLVLLIGGCYLAGSNPCLDYYFDPLAFNMQTLGFSGFTYRAVGYAVPSQISHITGGTGVGQASLTTPRFGYYSDRLGEELFTPPYSGPFKDRVFPKPSALQLIFILIFLPSVLAALYALSALAWSRFASFRCKVENKRRNWKPWPLTTPFLLFLTLTSLFHVVLVQFLSLASERPDIMSSRWPGGLDSTGTWTENRFNSNFVRSPTLKRPKTGIVSMYYDEKANGIWSQKNSGQRLGRGGYWLFIYLPMILAILYGRFWKVLDDEVKRIDKFYRLQLPGGCPAKSSICLEYHGFWSPLSIFQALRYRHWTVAVSSIGLVLGSITIPITQNYLFQWEVYSGGRLEWNDIYSWQVGSVDPRWANMLTFQLAAALICSSILLWLLPQQETGIYDNVSGIASILAVVPTPLPELGQDTHRMSALTIEETLERCWFRVLPAANSFGLVLEPVTRNMLPGWSLPWHPRLDKIYKSVTGPFVSFWKAMCPLCRRIRNYILGQPSSFIFRPEIFGTWLLILTLLLGFTANVAATMNGNAKDNLWNYVLPLSADFYFVIGIFILSIVDVVDANVRAFAPFTALRQGYQPPAILWADYTTGIPLWEIWTAFQGGQYLLGMSLLATLATVIYTIFLGSLQLSSSYFGGATFESDLSASTACSLLAAFVLAVHMALGWRFSWHRSQFLDRPPITLAASIPYVVFSPRLRDDFRRIGNTQGKRAQIMVLENLNRRYGLGFFKNAQGDEILGVERHHEDGGRLDVERPLQ